MRGASAETASVVALGYARTGLRFSLESRGRASEQGREVERGHMPLTGEGKVLTGDSVLAVAEDSAQQTDRLREIAERCRVEHTSPHRVFKRVESHLRFGDVVAMVEAIECDPLGVGAHLGKVAISDGVQDQPEQAGQCLPREHLPRQLVVGDMCTVKGGVCLVHYT